MSQEYSSSKRSRRTTRSQRNKPVLVTSANSSVEDETTPVSTAIIEEPKPLIVPIIEPVEKPIRKLPGFFSTVKKSEPETVTKEEKEAEIVQARLARATHGKAVAETTSTKSVKVPAVETKSTTPAVAAKPAAKPAPKGPFKTRHIIGLAVYIIAADFLGLFEQKILQSLGLEKQLGQFSLFGGTFHVETSTVAFLASLVIILVLLARFDLIPTSLGGSSARRPGSPTTRSSSNSTPGERTVQPTVRQGVKGSDDTLYQQYRDGQRRQKKK